MRWATGRSRVVGNPKVPVAGVDEGGGETVGAGPDDSAEVGAGVSVIVVSERLVASFCTMLCLIYASNLGSIGSLKDPGLVLVVLIRVDNPWRISAIEIFENSERSRAVGYGRAA